MEFSVQNRHQSCLTPTGIGLYKQQFVQQGQRTEEKQAGTTSAPHAWDLTLYCSKSLRRLIRCCLHALVPDAVYRLLQHKQCSAETFALMF
jgi:hypothetical protein